jgi:hypothetical protein
MLLLVSVFVAAALCNGEDLHAGTLSITGAPPHLVANLSLSFDGVNVSITALHSSNNRTSINFSLQKPSVARDVSLSKQNINGLIQRGEAVLASTKAAVAQLQEILAGLRE